MFRLGLHYFLLRPVILFTPVSYLISFIDRGYRWPGLHAISARRASSLPRHLWRRRELHLQFRHQLVLAILPEIYRSAVYEANGRSARWT